MSVFKDLKINPRFRDSIKKMTNDFRLKCLSFIRQDSYTYNIEKFTFHIWASSRENLSWRFPTKRDSNQSSQPQRLARNLKVHL